MICGNCGRSAQKVTIKFFPERSESCEHCADGGVHHDPAWMRHRPVPLYESRPHLYKKSIGPQGETVYQPTDENMADLEAQVCAVSAEDKAAIEARRNRPAKPIDMGKAEHIAAKFLQEFKEVTEEYEKANAECWNSAADELRDTIPSWSRHKVQ